MNHRFGKRLFMVLAGVFAIAYVFITSSSVAHAEGIGAVSINSVTIGGSNVNIVVSATDFPSSDDGVFYLYSPKDSEKMFEPIKYDSEMNAARYAWGVILIPPAIALDIVLLPVYAVGGVLFGVLMASAW